VSSAPAGSEASVPPPASLRASRAGTRSPRRAAATPFHTVRPGSRWRVGKDGPPADRVRADGVELRGETLLAEPPGELAQHFAPSVKRTGAPALGLAVREPELDATGKTTSFRPRRRLGGGFSAERRWSFRNIPVPCALSQEQVRPGRCSFRAWSGGTTRRSMSRIGFEPMTLSLKGRCSTTELAAPARRTRRAAVS
jgi:hypothetical protein